MEDDVARLEPRVARIEADVSQLNARVANVEVDLREFRKLTDRRLEVMDGKLDRLDANLESGFDTLRFALLMALLSAAVTLIAAVLGVLLGGPHVH